MDSNAPKRPKLTDFFGAVLEAKPRQIELYHEDVRIVAQFDAQTPAAAPAAAPKAADKKVQAPSFTKDSACMTKTPKPEHDLDFSDVLEAAANGLGGSDALFHNRGFLMAGLGATVRGANVEQVMRRHLDLHGTKTVDVDPNQDVKQRDGKDRNKNATSHDFGIVKADGTVEKVESKLTRPGFNTSMQLWALYYQNFKIGLSDRAFLGVEAPDALHVFEWDQKLKPGLSTHGKSTGGSLIQVYGPSGMTDLDKATDALLAKMRTKNTFLFRVDYTDEKYHDLFTRNTKGGRLYADVPLGTLSMGSRGHALDRIAQAVLAQYARCEIKEAPATKDLNGQEVGSLRTACDFLCNGQRAEHKGSLLSWDTTNEGFVLQFVKIKPGNFDVLALSLLTPRGIHIFSAPKEQAMKHLGKPTRQGDSTLQVRAPGGKKGYDRFEAAETFLLKNMASKHTRSMGFKYVAFVRFAEGDKERLMEANDSPGSEDDEEDEEEDEE